MTAPTPSLANPYSQYTILLVDDTPTNLGVLFEYLERYGFKIVVARDGESGIKRAQFVRPDIILLDVMMPGINGFETCQRLKADPSTREIPVIFMTALADTENKVQGFAVGAVDYVTKPLQQDEVLARVTSHLKIRDLTHSLQKKNRQLEASHLIAQRITSILDLNQLLTTVTELIQARFGYYYVGIWLGNEQQAAVLQAESGHDINQQLGVGFTLEAGAPQLAAAVLRSGQPLFSADVRAESQRLGLSGLPATRGELALPLVFANEVLGVLDVHSDQAGEFNGDDQTALQVMANQIAVAIRNARQYQLAENRARELAALNASKDKFFAVVAHDLRAPFTALLGLSLLQSRTPDTTPMAEVRHAARRIHNSARNAYGLLENLLQWSRLQLDRLEPEPERLELREVVARNTRLLKEVAASKNINLENKAAAGVQVYADENMLDTVLRNLISNALKFTPEGGSVTVLAAPPAAEIEGFLEIWVQDTGLGISAADIQKLFQLDKPHTTPGTAQEPGTGLGLLLCQEMVVKNGGRLWIESEGVPDKGTTVKFTVPIRAPATHS